MVVDYIRYAVPTTRVEEFEAAYRQAGEILRGDAHCLRHEVATVIEEPEHYTALER